MVNSGSTPLATSCATSTPTVGDKESSGRSPTTGMGGLAEDSTFWSRGRQGSPPIIDGAGTGVGNARGERLSSASSATDAALVFGNGWIGLVPHFGRTSFGLD